MSDWVPIDRATIDTERIYEVMYRDGTFEDREGSSICKDSVVALRDLTLDRDTIQDRNADIKFVALVWDEKVGVWTLLSVAKSYEEMKEAVFVWTGKGVDDGSIKVFSTASVTMPNTQ